MPERRFEQGILQAIIDISSTVKKGDLVIFDLDSTLLDNRPRQVQIIREYGLVSKLPLLENFEIIQMDGWSLELSLQHAGLSKEEASFYKKDLYMFWEKRFFTSEYCLYDIETPGAAHYVRKILESGARIVYCTGRHLAMKEGTIQNLQSLGFPIPDDNQVFLLLKPYFELEDDDWKQQAYRKISSLGQVLAVFDNEPSHINGYKKAYPDALCVHLYTDESGRGVPVLPEILSIHHFILL